MSMCDEAQQDGVNSLCCADYNSVQHQAGRLLQSVAACLQGTSYNQSTSMEIQLMQWTLMLRLKSDNSEICTRMSPW